MPLSLWPGTAFCGVPVLLSPKLNSSARVASRRQRPCACATKPGAQTSQPVPNDGTDDSSPSPPGDYDEFSRLLGSDGKEVQRRVELDLAPKERVVDDAAYDTFNALLGGGRRKLKGGRQFANLGDARRRASQEKEKQGGFKPDFQETSKVNPDLPKGPQSRDTSPPARTMSEAEIADAYAFMEGAFATAKDEGGGSTKDEAPAPQLTGPPAPSSRQAPNKVSLTPKPRHDTDEPALWRASNSSSASDPTRIATADMSDMPVLAKAPPPPPLLNKPAGTQPGPGTPGENVEVGDAGAKALPRTDTSPLSSAEIESGYREMDSFLGVEKAGEAQPVTDVPSSHASSKPVVKKPRHPNEDRTDVPDPTRMQTAKLDAPQPNKPPTPPPELLNKPAGPVTTNVGSKSHISLSAQETEAVSDALSSDVELLAPPSLASKPVASTTEGSKRKGHITRFNDLPVLLLQNPKIVRRRSRAALILPGMQDGIRTPSTALSGDTNAIDGQLAQLADGNEGGDTLPDIEAD